MPLIAQTAIQTSGEGLTSGRIEIDVNGFKVPAYRSAPAGKTNLPVVLVISEIFGVHEYIADITRRLAKEGYLAIAPEMFVRQGDPSQYKEIAKLQSEIIAKVPDAQVIADLDATVQWATQNGGNANRVAITGFCWGGRITWLSATMPEVRAGVAWYGRLVGEKTAGNPRHPVDIAAELKAPVLGLYGSADTGIPLESVDKMRQALAVAGSKNLEAKASRFEIYLDAPHAFHADYRETYRAGPAADGWVKCLDWFKRNGVA
jgi:carboxymethylenebutenolidase